MVLFHILPNADKDLLILELDGFFTKSSPGDPSHDVLIVAG
jgi:hypothetical protein